MSPRFTSHQVSEIATAEQIKSSLKEKINERLSVLDTQTLNVLNSEKTIIGMDPRTIGSISGKNSRRGSAFSNHQLNKKLYSMSIQVDDKRTEESVIAFTRKNSLSHIDTSRYRLATFKRGSFVGLMNLKSTGASSESNSIARMPGSAEKNVRYLKR